jgi:hypothetical protein
MYSPDSSYYKNNLYLEYYKPGLSYHDKVKFFEEYKHELVYLPKEEYREIGLDYQLALFEIGRYYTFLLSVDIWIEFVIMERIQGYNGLDIYAELLFKKAASLYNLSKFEESLVILNQLKNISPKMKEVALLKHRCYRHLRKEQTEIFQTIGIVAIICGICLTLARIFVIDPFYNEYLQSFSLTANSMIAFGVITLAANEVYQWFYYRNK